MNLFAIDKIAQVSFRPAVEVKIKSLYPRKRKFDASILTNEQRKEVDDSLQIEKWRKNNQRLLNKVRTLKDEIKDLATQAKIKLSDTMHKVHSVYHSTYSSQPGYHKYAHASAKLWMLDREKLGIKFELRSTDNGFEVWAGVKDDVDITILTEMVGLMTIKEWVKSCWKMGTNPSVLCPFLPAGLEENLGIDYFGNDIKK